MREGWQYKKYQWNEVLTIINGKNQSAVVSDEGKYPIYGSGGIMGFANEYLCPENCVIIGRKGNINKPIYVTDKFWNVDTAFGLSADSTLLLPKYLYYFCLDYNFEKHNKTVTIPSLTKVDLLKINISLPSVEQQRLIASELDKITEMISKYDEQLKELDKLSQSIFYEMFGDPVENEKGWEVKKLGNVSNVKTGPFGSLLHKSDYVDGCVPLINPIHIKDFKIVIDNSFTLTNEKASELSDYLLKENDVIFARRGDIGRCAIVSSEEQGYLCGTGSLFVRFLDGISPTFTMYIVRSISFVNELISKAKGSTMLNLNSKTMEDLSIILPPLPLQQSFARKIEAVEAMKSKVKEAKKEAETLLAARMQYWFE